MHESKNIPDDGDLISRRKPMLGLIGLSLSIGAILFFFIGAWLIKANTPKPPQPTPVSLNHVAKEFKRELAEESVQIIDSTKDSLAQKWMDFRDSSQDAKSGNVIEENTDSADQSDAMDLSQAAGPINIEIENRSDGFRFAISLGRSFTAPPRPAWVDWVENSILFIIFGASGLGVVLGAASQVRGEYPAWGMAAELIGACTISLTLLAIWVAMIVAAAVAIALIAVLGALTGVSIDFSI